MSLVVSNDRHLSGTRVARVLVVDDNQEMRVLLERILRRDGHLVEHAANGRDALERLAGGGFDVVLTDLLMPEMDGIELIRELSARAPDMPVVALSGADITSGLLRAARVFGALVALEKTVSPTVIRDAIREILHAREEHREPAVA
jgi:CheY-like chemotaxis protein